jgi:hypothetical protein
LAERDIPTDPNSGEKDTGVKFEVKGNINW